jgi:hypothetical protein
MLTMSDARAHAKFERILTAQDVEPEPSAST